MNQTLEKDIVNAMHHLNTDQLRDVKRYVERLSCQRRIERLLTDEELTMLRELNGERRHYR
ncbi:hypothetical protein [Vibrio hangzhouensis]|uniref:Uncharacterized protein n=1 Tax=Vibrio hangzhouensis TaxID=462991 RepID=A0A1H5TA58_9VIBR|nr:hypothetical protein [Vibrio hangzhouensis]SEF59762.1 hypothetical protein SAMN04488244_102183 [Vibrio hangzhouensis]